MFFDGHFLAVQSDYSTLHIGENEPAETDDSVSNMTEDSWELSQGIWQKTFCAYSRTWTWNLSFRLIL